MAGRSTPDKLMSFKLALQLYRTFNYKCPTNDWLSINFNSVRTSRQNKLSINKTNRLKVGMKILLNRFNTLNGKIDLNWLNLGLDTYKINCKKLFL